jgi:RNA polymerase sigma-70 factor (ECF subfamily)
VQADSSQSLEALYRLHSKDLLRFLIARTGDATEAEDIVQEIWIRLQRISGVPVTSGRAYLFRMAQNLVVDRIREKQRRIRREQLWLSEHGLRTVAGESVDPTLSAEDAIIEREETDRLAGAIEEMPEGARRVFELHKREGLSHAEVAMKLGISKSGVEKHMAVAMKYVRRALLD